MPRPGDPIFPDLAELLQTADPAAESLIAWVSDTIHGRAQFDAALDYGIESLTHPPRPLVDFFAAIERRPAWAAPAHLAPGCEAHLRLGRLGQMAVAALGLVAGYRNSAVAKSLITTGSLTDATKRRIDETTKFMLHVYDSGGMTRSSDGFKSAARVRIVHAYVRRGLARSPEWRPEVWGPPISMLDTLGTALQFWVPTVLAAPTFGYHLTVAECNSQRLLWNYVALIQGVPERALPQSLEEAYRLYCAMWMLAGQPDDDSKRLGRAFITALSEGDRPSQIRGKAFHGAIALLVPKAHRAELGIDDTVFKLWPLLLRPFVRSMEGKRLRDPARHARAVDAGRQILYDDLEANARIKTIFDPHIVVHNLQALAG
jgi:hypothetical protein